MLDIFSFFVYTVRGMNKQFYNKLINKDSEESYKSGWVTHFAKVYKKVGELPSVNTVSRIDHYTKKMLYEFKYKTYFNTKRAKAKVIAQALYYIHHIYVGRVGYQTVTIPSYIACISMYTGMIFKTELFLEFYTSKKYDWFIRACNASNAKEGENLVDDLMKSPLIDKIKVYDFSNQIEEKAFIEYHNSIQLGECKIIKGGITSDNISYVYDLWKDKFAKIFLSKKNTNESDEHYLRAIFLKDIINDGTTFDSVTKKVTVIGEGITVQIGSYESFWQNYDKIDDMEIIEHLRQTADRLLDTDVRAMQGSFYTPPPLAERAMYYIEKQLGKIDWDSGKFRLYDPAGGHGNIICRLPKNVLKHCYISTFEKSDSDYNANTYEGVTAWQYDYVNDDIEVVPCGKKKKLFNFNYKKLPKNFVEDLNNPEITWIILVNPPYGTAADMSRKLGKSKKGINNTSFIHDWMIADGLSGKSTQEFYCQFVYRICKEFEGKKAYLGMFSKVTYLNSINNESLRDCVFRKKFLTGFGFRSKMFYGVKGDFLVSFMLWDLNTDIHVKNQEIIIDLLDENIEKFGFKTIPTNGAKHLNSAGSYFERPDATIECLGYTGALNYSDGSNHKVKNRNMRSEDAIFFCRLSGNSLKEQSNSFISSGPCFGSGGFSVNKENVRGALIAFSSMQAQNKTWINDNDMLYVPNEEVDDEFANDCIVYSMVSNGNYSSSIASYKYNDDFVRIPCEVFPFTHSEVSSWECHFDEIKEDLLADTKDRFYATLLNDAELSSESLEVMDSLRNLYKYFFLHVHEGDWGKWETKNWDVGLYQVRNFVKSLDTQEGNNLLSSLRDTSKKLKEKVQLGTLKYKIVY